MIILAARLLFPPDLIVPAEASAPRMKLTGPDAVPPPFNSSCEDRILERLTPAPDPPLKMVPSSTYQLRIESIESSTERMKQLWTRRSPLRYSPLWVWMSKTSISPRTSIDSTGTHRNSPSSIHCRGSPTANVPASTKAPLSRSPLVTSLERHTRWSGVTSRWWPDVV